MERPAIALFPMVAKYPGAALLKRRSGGSVPSAVGASSTKRGFMLSSPSIVIEEARPTEATPGTCATRSAMLWCARATCSSSVMRRRGMATRNVWISSGLYEAGRNQAHRDEGSDHQSRTDQQRQSQGDL